MIHDVYVRAAGRGGQCVGWRKLRALEVAMATLLSLIKATVGGGRPPQRTKLRQWFFAHLLCRPRGLHSEHDHRGGAGGRSDLGNPVQGRRI